MILARPERSAQGQHTVGAPDRDLAHRIDAIEARNKHKQRRPPGWRKLSDGCHLGLRKMTRGLDGTWLAQAHDPEPEKPMRRSLGVCAHVTTGQHLDAAKKAAEAGFSRLGKGESVEGVTVKKACEDSIAHVRTAKRDTQADDIKTRLSRWADSDKIAAIELPKLTRQRLGAALDVGRAVVAKPAAISRVHAPGLLEHAAARRARHPIRGWR